MLTNRTKCSLQIKLNSIEGCGFKNELKLIRSIYTSIYVYTQQYCTIVSNYNFYLVRGDMFRLPIQPSSGQLKIEKEP